MKLEGKVAIVTGTSPNIGGAIAEGLAAEGATVACLDSRPANASDCAKSICAAGGKAIALSADVTSEPQVREAVETAWSKLGGVDILVNNAAFFNHKGVLEMSYEEWQKQIAVILGGAFLCTRHVALAMIAHHRAGSIVNIISTAGHQGEPRNIAYCTAKSGLLNFTRSAAMELIPHRIRVNSLTPTATDPAESLERAARWGRSTPDPAKLDAAFQPFRSRVAMQRLPRPSDYARAAVFLASDDAAMITGADLRVDAGATAQYWAWDPSRSNG